MADPTPAGGGDLGPLLKRFQDLEQRVSGLERPSGTQRGQVLRDLLGRVSYAVSDSSNEAWTVTQPNDQPWGPTLAFELTEERVVSLQFIVSGTVQAYPGTGTSPSGYARLTPMVFLDGVGVGPNQPNLHLDLVGEGGNIGAPLVARALVTVPAGNHTLQGGFARRLLFASSGTLFGLLDVDDPTLIVDVLQTSS